ARIGNAAATRGGRLRERRRKRGGRRSGGGGTGFRTGGREGGGSPGPFPARRECARPRLFSGPRRKSTGVLRRGRGYPKAPFYSFPRKTIDIVRPISPTDTLFLRAGGNLGAYRHEYNGPERPLSGNPAGPIRDFTMI